MTKDKIGFREAVSIGAGGMVGGGIFAVLGLAVSTLPRGKDIPKVRVQRSAHTALTREDWG